MAQASIPTAAQSGNNAPTPVPFVFKGSQVRTVMFENHPWFVTKDVCAALGISWNGKLLASMPEGHVQVRNLRTRTRTGQMKTHKTSLINKPGAHQLAARSKSPEAEEFSAWLDTNTPTQPETEDSKSCVKPDNGAVFFAFNEAQVRVVMRDDSPWFVAKDVCDALGFANPSDATKYLDEDERTLISNPSGKGGSKTTAVNESGLYSLIMRSRKPEAKAFKKWVTSEVLPAIRRQGRYEASVQEAPAVEQPPKRRADRLERRPLVELVRSWVAVAPIGYGRAHQQVNAIMGVATIEDMTPEQVREAMVWVKKRIEEAHASKMQQPFESHALPGGVPHSEAIRDIAGKMADDIDIFRRSIENHKAELVELLGPRLWWGQRNAAELSELHKARCQASHSLMDVVADSIMNLMVTSRTMVGLVRAQADLEKAAELVHPVENFR